MLYIKAGTRMLQGQSNIRNSTFALFNTQLEEQFEISSYAAKMLRKAHNAGNIDSLLYNTKTKDFILELLEAGFIVEETSTSASDDYTFLGTPIPHRYPLSNLSIELTNGCNLQCRHCYGSFPQLSKYEFVPFDWIKQSVDELNALHVRKVALTGGESTIHPHFLEIAMFFLEHGFELCVFTNGYNPEIIEKLLTKSHQYHFMIKVSLDGPEDVHNLIRGSKNSYLNTLKTLEAISSCSNVDLYISTVVMRQNITSLENVENMIKAKFPKAVHTKDLAFPLGNACDCAFSLDELPLVDQLAPSLFLAHETGDLSEQRSAMQKKIRCTGGITQCTLMPSGFLKICNSACDEQFYFKHNVFLKGIKFAWLNCGKKITKFRHEKAKQTPQCKNCQYVKDCRLNDCRVLAWAYTNDASKSNPIACYMQHKMNGGTKT